MSLSKTPATRLSMMVRIKNDQTYQMMKMQKLEVMKVKMKMMKVAKRELMCLLKIWSRISRSLSIGNRRSPWSPLRSLHLPTSP